MVLFLDKRGVTVYIKARVYYCCNGVFHIVKDQGFADKVVKLSNLLVYGGLRAVLSFVISHSVKVLGFFECLKNIFADSYLFLCAVGQSTR